MLRNQTQIYKIMDTPRLKTKYLETIKSELMTELGMTNTMAVPTISKVVINVGMGKEATSNSNAVAEMVEDITLIAGQKPIVTKSKLAISNFKLRENMDNGIKVTLRGDRMWDFTDKLISIVLPRIKDFRGVSATAFDGHGNYALGIKEHTVFPEIDTSKLGKIRSMQVIICTTAATDEQAYKLLEKFGMPFKKKQVKQESK